MRTKVIIGAAITALTAAALAGTSAAEPSDSSAVTPQESSTLAREMSVRAEFGLNTSTSYILSTDSSPSADTTRLGIPLSPAEVKEMGRRSALSSPAADIADAVDRRWAGVYGGDWIDQADGGQLVVAVTSIPTGLSELVTSMLPTTAQFQIKQVTNTLKQLTDLQSRIDSDWQNWANKGIQINMTATYPMDNDVGVVLHSGSSLSDVAAIRAAYGSTGLKVTIPLDDIKPAADRYAGIGPVFGGSRTVSTYAGSTYGCTSSTSAVGTTGKLFGITAGHCGGNGAYYLGTDQFGTTKRNYEGPGYSADDGWINSSMSSPTDCDCTDFGPLPSGAASNSVIVNGGALYTFTKYAALDASYMMGRSACVSGATTNAVLCDQIRSILAHYHGLEPGIGTGYVRALVQIDCPVLDGDSGAPLGDGPVWLGVLSGGIARSSSCGQDSYSVYSRTEYLASVTGDTPNLPSHN